MEAIGLPLAARDLGQLPVRSASAEEAFVCGRCPADSRCGLAIGDPNGEWKGTCRPEGAFGRTAPPEKFEIQPSQLGTRQDNVKMHLERMAATGTNPFSTAAIITAGTSTRFCQLSIDIAMTITKAEVAEMFAFPT